MKIELKQIKVRDIVSGYTNNEEEGVTGFNGSLNIRPPYQREFVYKDKQQKAVISTIVRGFPLNTMYWVKNEDNSFELLDGQQRTMSICEFVEGNFFQPLIMAKTTKLHPVTIMLGLLLFVVLYTCKQKQ